MADDKVKIGQAIPPIVGMAGGSDGTLARALKTDTSGELQVDVLSSALPSGAATETTLALVKTAVEIMDDWDESDRAKVNLIVGQAGIAAGAGAVGVTVPRVTWCSDSPGIGAIGSASPTSALAVQGAADNDAPTDLNKAAPNAADGTHTVDYNMQGYDRLSVQFEWTAGGAGGTAALTVLGSMSDTGNFVDITNSAFGVASLTATGMLVDNGRYCGCFCRIRLSLTIANKDATTAYTTLVRRSSW